MTGRAPWAVAALALLSSVAACARPPRPGDPIAGLSAADRERFTRGRAVFDSVFTPATGVGPLFNSTACGECHEDPAAGGAGDEVEIHASAFHTDGPVPFCDPLVAKGGPVFQQLSTPALREALGRDGEPVPAEATGRARRTSVDIFGFGLLDAVPDSVILALSDPDDRDGDGISGRVNRFVDGRLGRFGRKAFVPTLRDFNAGAFPIEQGVTNPAAPNEQLPGGNPLPAGTDPVPEPELGQDETDLTDFFVRFLAPPAARRASRDAQAGRELFARIGCDACHVPSLRTGRDAPRPLQNRDVYAYTNLLLHDMGPDLADICLGLATPAEFRTEPLMGLRLMTQFLHDGRATTLDQAIEFHGGEAAGARDRFRALSQRDRETLLAFLRTL
ncbi:MAG: di-heme oxidoredictase family protein [Gemmatimonadales bacterium]